MLTVEWDTHKTVLVDVSGENARSNDVEMSGMSGPGSSGAGGGDSLSGRDRSEYGRLEDDEVGWVLHVHPLCTTYTLGV